MDISVSLVLASCVTKSPGQWLSSRWKLWKIWNNISNVNFCSHLPRDHLIKYLVLIKLNLAWNFLLKALHNKLRTGTHKEQMETSHHGLTVLHKPIKLIILKCNKGTNTENENFMDWNNLLHWRIKLGFVYLEKKTNYFPELKKEIMKNKNIFSLIYKISWFV